MFELDRSASHGLMATRGLYVFEHESMLGNAPAHELFEQLIIGKRGPDNPAREFAEYRQLITLPTAVPDGVTLHSLPTDMKKLFGG